MDTQYSRWVSRWQATVDACERMGGYHVKLSVGPPASLEAITEVEALVGQSLPTSFRQVLLDFSAEVEVYWSLKDGIRPPKPCPQITHGECGWSLSRMPEIAHWYQEWLKVFDPHDPYDRIWYDKLAFAEVGNGDNIAFDVQNPQDMPAVYLSHDGDDAHGYCLGNNFVDYITRHSLLGCAGPEGWLMMPFLPDAESGLDVRGEKARMWREWFGLDFEVGNL